MELNLVRNVKGSKQGCYNHTGDERKPKECVSLLLNEMGNLVKQDVEKAEVQNASFASGFRNQTSLQESQVPDTRGKVVQRRCALGGKASDQGRLRQTASI